MHFCKKCIKPKLEPKHKLLNMLNKHTWTFLRLVHVCSICRQMELFSDGVGQLFNEGTVGGAFLGGAAEKLVPVIGSVAAEGQLNTPAHGNIDGSGSRTANVSNMGIKLLGHGAGRVLDRKQDAFC